MMYEKLTPEKFTEKLKNKEYQDLTGARRAIGKASWPEAHKATARTQAEKFFGTGGLAKLKAKPAKAPKVKAKAEASEAKPAKVKKAAPQKRAAAAVAGEPAYNSPVVGKPLTAADIRKNPFQVIQLAEHCVASGTGVLNAATAMVTANPQVDVAELTKDAVQTIRNGLDLASRVIVSLAEGMELPKIINDAISNGAAQTSPVPGEPVYTAPAATS
jgi:hypothetical protein